LTPERWFYTSSCDGLNWQCFPNEKTASITPNGCNRIRAPRPGQTGLKDFAVLDAAMVKVQQRISRSYPPGWGLFFGKDGNGQS